MDSSLVVPFVRHAYFCFEIVGAFRNSRIFRFDVRLCCGWNRYGLFDSAFAAVCRACFSGRSLLMALNDAGDRLREKEGHNGIFR
jgi:hypothetical protein